MRQVTIYTTDKEYSHFVELARNLHYVKKIETDKQTEKGEVLDNIKAGLKEIQLPPVQPGSSIMPGKYNPVMAEMISMVCFQVMGFDRSIEMAAQAGQLELNVMMPLIAYNLIQSIEILGNAIKALTEQCIVGITANPERCHDYAEGSLALVTALNTHIGYLNAANVAKESLATGKSLRQIVLDQGLMTPELLAQVLDLAAMSQLPT